MERRSEETISIPLPTADIGATNTAAVDATYWGAWQDMSPFMQVFAKVRLGAFDAADVLNVCKLQQAQDAAGTGAKDLTTAASGGDYDSDNPVKAAGDQVILEAQAADLDVAGGFRYVRVYCAVTGNTGPDNVEGVIELHDAHHEYAQREGAASASKVYVRPS